MSLKMERRRCHPDVRPSCYKQPFLDWFKSMGSYDINALFMKLSRFVGDKGSPEWSQLRLYHELCSSIFRASKTGRVDANHIEVTLQVIDADVGARLNFTDRPIHKVSEKAASLVLRLMSHYRELKDQADKRHRAYKRMDPGDRARIDAVLEAIESKPVTGDSQAQGPFTRLERSRSFADVPLDPLQDTCYWPLSFAEESSGSPIRVNKTAEDVLTRFSDDPMLAKIMAFELDVDEPDKGSTRTLSRPSSIEQISEFELEVSHEYVKNNSAHRLCIQPD